MKKKIWKNAEVMGRIDAARRTLIDKGFHCLSGGDFGLPSYSDVEAWARGKLMVYLVFDRQDGSWDLLASIDRTNTDDGVWVALGRLMEANK